MRFITSLLIAAALVALPIATAQACNECGVAQSVVVKAVPQPAKIVVEQPAKVFRVVPPPQTVRVIPAPQNFQVVPQAQTFQVTALPQTFKIVEAAAPSVCLAACPKTRRTPLATLRANMAARSADRTSRRAEKQSERAARLSAQTGTPSTTAQVVFIADPNASAVGARAPLPEKKPESPSDVFGPGSPALPSPSN